MNSEELFAERRKRWRHDREKNLFAPLRVEAALRSPVAFLDCIPLDSILASAVMAEVLGAEFFFGRGGLEKLGGFGRVPLPLAIKGDHRGWFYRASFGLVSSGALISASTWKKRWEDEFDYLVDFDGNRERISLSVGKYKSYNMPLIICSTPKLIFYCIGDRDAISGLLELSPLVGKKTSQGYGEVKSWDIVEDESAWKRYRLRALPAKIFSSPGPGWQLRLATYHSPYWDMARAVDCFCPPPEAMRYDGN